MAATGQQNRRGTVGIQPYDGPVRHLDDIRRLTPEDIELLLARAAYHDGWIDRRPERWTHPRTLPNLLLVSLFYEASSRTAGTFKAAAHYTGMHWDHTDNAAEFSSRIKGEGDYDGMRAVMAWRPDAVVVRHDKTGALPEIIRRLEADGFVVPFINAGDGRGQHPTQTLLDLRTIQKRLGRITGLHVGIVGDIANGRTAKSLVYELGRDPSNRFTFISPPGLGIDDAPDDVGLAQEIREHGTLKDYLDRHGVEYREIRDTSVELADVVGDLDVLYVLRVQVERLAPMIEASNNAEILRRQLQAFYDDVAPHFRVTPAVMRCMQSHAIVEHPLPRISHDGTVRTVKVHGYSFPIVLMSELTEDCDLEPQAAYMGQMDDGLPIRMSVLEWTQGVI